MTVRPEFLYHHPRSQKARFAVRFGAIWHTIVIAACVALFASGIWSIIEHGAIGWVLMGTAGPMIMIAVWWQVDLKTIAVSDTVHTIDDCMAADVLGRLPLQPTLQDIAEAAIQSRAGHFMAVRLGITPNVIRDAVAISIPDMNDFWQRVLTIQTQSGSEKITGAVLMAAIIQQAPGSDGILAGLHLSFDDVISGIQWYERLKALIAAYKEKPLNTGGIARDWSFGYTPLLNRFGQNLSQQVSGGIIMTHLEAHQDALDSMLGIFASGGRQNITLIGPDGAGKSTVIAAFAEMLIDGHKNVPPHLLYQQVFLLDASALISAAKSRGDLEALLTQILNEAYASKNIILCLENAQLFFEEGVGSIDITTLLQPVLEAGRLRVILSMDQQRFLQISQRSAKLTNALNTIVINPASQQETLAIMRDQLISFEARHNVTYMHQSLLEAYRVSDRYIQDIAMPGKALTVLEAAAQSTKDGLVTAQAVDDAMEKTLGVKIAAASGQDERQKLLNLETLIHQRMIGQTRAVQVVSDAIRRARAGVRNQSRPIGTFLFLGPTGVGKTELSKALSEIYFEGEDNIIRLDLNEFVRAEDVARLIADGAHDPLSLTAQVRKRPFSVVLLDEIEKAHPQVLTTLLQVLDEGILRDEKNRDINFRDTIIIATSNAGAERIQEYIARGYQLEQFEETFINELISGNLFRPEFLNRFDEIVLFRPLEKTELLQVIDLILAGVNKTLEPQKIQVAVEPMGKEMLVNAGYDPRLGARPMRRVVQRAVENVVAKQLLAGTLAPGSTTIITAEQIQAILGQDAR